jgi:hypothetical protein
MFAGMDWFDRFTSLMGIVSAVSAVIAVIASLIAVVLQRRTQRHTTFQQIHDVLNDGGSSTRWLCGTSPLRASFRMPTRPTTTSSTAR